MIIAVSSQGNELTSPIDPRFGRAQYFIIYNTDDDSFEAVSNDQNVQAAQGAGVQAAQTVVRQKAELAISGNFGPKAHSALRATGIKTALFSDGTVGDAIELAKTGKLNFTDSANVEGHWS
jgi:predicted Fe-Mo cluster-binding NifX family protein